MLTNPDRFKAIVSGHGHKAGDQVLIAFAQHRNDQSKNADLAGRFGVK